MPRSLLAAAGRNNPTGWAATSPTVANWDARGGYLKPPEPDDPMAIDDLLKSDLAGLYGGGR